MKDSSNFKGKVTRLIKCIATEKYDLSFHYRDAKEISFYYFRDTKLSAKHEKTHVNSIYIVEKGMVFI